jgi:hypothetical protein
MKPESTRESFPSLLAELAVLAPEVRLGQLLAHLAFLAEDEYGKSMSTVEDGEMIAILQRHRRELQARKHAVV